MAETTGLTGTQRDAYAAVLDLFRSYGLETLAPKILEYVQQGFSGDTIAIELQQTPEYKTRFSGNEARRKAGLRVLSPAEYLSMEQGYRQVMQAAGLPAGFYDHPDDFSNFIAKDTSVAEINDRVGSAVKIARNTDPGYRDMLAKTFGVGLTDGDIAAFVLDQKRALPVLQRQIDAIGIAEAARRNGLEYTAGRANQLAAFGVSAEQAGQAYSAIAQIAKDDGRLARAVGEDYSQTDAENEALLGMDSARRKRQKVEQKFSAYNPKDQSRGARGALGREVNGSY